MKLLDLGVARLPMMEDFPSADIPGTLSYMAPEMFAGGFGDISTDIYALGVTLYRMFTRAYPHGEIEPFSRPRFDRPKPLSAHRPELPSWLDRVLGRAVAVQPEVRFEDAVELAFALEQAALQAAPAHRSLLARNPLRFYHMLSLILAVLLAGVTVWGLQRETRSVHASAESRLATQV